MTRYEDAKRVSDRLYREHGSNDPFAQALRFTRMPMVITDPRQPDNPIVFANDAFLKLSGYEREEVIGRNCRFLQGPYTNKETVKEIREAISAGQPIQRDILNYRKDGTPFWNALFISPVIEKSEISYFFASQLEVTEKKNREIDMHVDRSFLDEQVQMRTTELRIANDNLREALREKTMLINEVDHRVKNNLQIISSLISLQMRRLQDEGTKDHFEAMLQRVNALKLVHGQTYPARDASRFDLTSFLHEMVAERVGLADGVTVHIALDPITIQNEKAAAVALILNEIFENALKHGLPNGGDLTLSLVKKDDHIRIAITDAPRITSALPQKPASFGMTIIRALAIQLQANVTFNTTDRGTEVEVLIPVDILECR